MDLHSVRYDKYTVFKDLSRKSLPGCDFFCERMINIPVGWWLDQKDLEKIVNVVNDYKR